MDKSELVVLQSGNSKVHYATRVTLSPCTYFQSKLARWNTEDTIQLDMDDESLSIILTLLRYGPEGQHPLDPWTHAKVRKDAMYLGLPDDIIKWLYRDEKEEDEIFQSETMDDAERKLDQWFVCTNCHQRTAMDRWKCIGCKSLTSNEVFDTHRPYPIDVRLHKCKKCNRVEFTRRVVICLTCDRYENKQ